MKHSHLSHIDIKGFYQFITFRTHDSIDNFLRKLSVEEKLNNEKQSEINDYLDISKNGAYLNSDIVKILSDFFINKNNILYELIAFCIMPNHIHLLIKPFQKIPLTMQIIKGTTSKIINEKIGKKGKFWAGDYYDKAIRDEKHFQVVYNYIKNNPLKIHKDDTVYSRFYGIYN